MTRTLIDLGTMPLANSYLPANRAHGDEPRYPLHARVCDECLLVQVESVVASEDIFTDYAYFSSYADSWVEHARRFAVQAVRGFALDSNSQVVEVASNDGYLLRHFVAAGIPVLGVEPAANVAKVAIEAGIPTEIRFFGREAAADLVGRGCQADLLAANNVLAHVPDLDDFVTGMAMAVKPSGVITIEVPHLLRLIAGTQFDTIYHEHLSYFSVRTLDRLLAERGLAAFDVEELPTHGGSLRIWAAPTAAGRPVSPRLSAVRDAEEAAGLHLLDAYVDFNERVERCRASLVEFLRSARAQSRTVVAYGAAAKGNTLLNYCGVTVDDVAYVVDRSPHKQGRLLPGSHLPIEPPDRVAQTCPDFVLILPWNLRDEVMEQMAVVRDWGGRFQPYRRWLDALPPKSRTHDRPAGRSATGRLLTPPAETAGRRARDR